MSDTLQFGASSSSTPPSLVIHPDDEVEQEYECLERSLRTLTESDRKLVIDYYREEKGARIEHRRQLARRRGIALNALRIRAHRIRETLHQCTLHCLGRRMAG